MKTKHVHSQFFSLDKYITKNAWSKTSRLPTQSLNSKTESQVLYLYSHKNHGAKQERKSEQNPHHGEQACDVFDEFDEFDVTYTVAESWGKTRA